MKKQSLKNGPKLKLSRETLCDLEQSKLKEVAGGVPITWSCDGSCRCGVTTNC
jgi:hypothetical protein